MNSFLVFGVIGDDNRCLRKIGKLLYHISAAIKACTQRGGGGGAYLKKELQVQWSLGYPASMGPGHNRIPETTGYAKQHYNHSVSVADIAMVPRVPWNPPFARSTS